MGPLVEVVGSSVLVVSIVGGAAVSDGPGQRKNKFTFIYGTGWREFQNTCSGVAKGGGIWGYIPPLGLLATRSVGFTVTNLLDAI